jgi:hypothetical protein
MTTLEKKFGTAIFGLDAQQPFPYQMDKIISAVKIAEDYARIRVAEALEKAAQASCALCDAHVAVELASEAERQGGIAFVHIWTDGSRKLCTAAKLRAIVPDASGLLAEQYEKLRDDRDLEWIGAMGAGAVDLHALGGVDIKNYVQWLIGSVTAGPEQDIARLESEVARLTKALELEHEDLLKVRDQEIEAELQLTDLRTKLQEFIAAAQRALGQAHAASA